MRPLNFGSSAIDDDFKLLVGAFANTILIAGEVHVSLQCEEPSFSPTLYYVRSRGRGLNGHAKDGVYKS